MKVKIIAKFAEGPDFENIEIGSEHEILPTPDKECGLWVNGSKNQPVKLISEEFVIIP